MNCRVLRWELSHRPVGREEDLIMMEEMAALRYSKYLPESTTQWSRSPEATTILLLDMFMIKANFERS